MADCYWHGYSGGPGGCSDCEFERQRGLQQGSTPGNDAPMTAKERDYWWNARYRTKPLSKEEKEEILKRHDGKP